MSNFLLYCVNFSIWIAEMSWLQASGEAGGTLTWRFSIRVRAVNEFWCHGPWAQSAFKSLLGIPIGVLNCWQSDTQGQLVEVVT